MQALRTQSHVGWQPEGEFQIAICVVSEKAFEKRVLSVKTSIRLIPHVRWGGLEFIPTGVFDFQATISEGGTRDDGFVACL